MPPPKLKLIPGKRNAYGTAFAAIARCACGHDAQLPEEWVNKAASYSREFALERARLRCSKCGRRNPLVEVYNAG
jgi:hypothetical protein